METLPRGLESTSGDIRETLLDFLDRGGRVGASFLQFVVEWKVLLSPGDARDRRFDNAERDVNHERSGEYHVRWKWEFYRHRAATGGDGGGGNAGRQRDLHRESWRVH